MLGHWIHDSEFGIVSMIDDGDRCYEFFPLLGFAFITALEAVDTAGQLHEGSDIRDLGLVMSLFADWRLEDGLADGEDLEISWRETVVAYAKKASIDLEAIRPHAMKPVLEDSKDVQPVRAAPKSKAADRWGFKKMVGRRAPNHDRLPLTCYAPSLRATRKTKDWPGMHRSRADRLLISPSGLALSVRSMPSTRRIHSQTYRSKNSKMTASCSDELQLDGMYNLATRHLAFEVCRYVCI